MGVCKNIDHFPEDAEYEQDTSEYLLRAVRASSLFPIMSVGLLFVGGVCVAASEFYKSRHNVILSAGIFFVSAGLSNIVGIIVYISANSGDPNQSESKRNHWYGWSFYCGALSFIIAETVGALTVHLFIDAHRSGVPRAPFRRPHHFSSGYRQRYHRNELALYPLADACGYTRASSPALASVHGEAQRSVKAENGGIPCARGFVRSGIPKNSALAPLSDATSRRITPV